MDKPIIVAVGTSLAIISLIFITVQLQYIQQSKQDTEINIGEVTKPKPKEPEVPKESSNNYQDKPISQESSKQVEEQENRQESKELDVKQEKQTPKDVKQEKQTPREQVEVQNKEEQEKKVEVQIQCIPSSQTSLLSNAELKLSKEEGFPGSGIQVITSIRSTEYNDIFKYNNVKLAWFKGDERLNEWLTSSIEWDYIDDTTLEGRSILYTKVPEITSGDVYILACFGSSKGELGYTLALFKVVEKPKAISYYRVDSIDDVYKRMYEALNDRGLSVGEGYLENMIGEDISRIEVKKGYYMLFDAKQISMDKTRDDSIDENSNNIGVLACISPAQYLIINETIYCITIGKGAEIKVSLSIDNYESNKEKEGEERGGEEGTESEGNLTDSVSTDESSSSIEGVEYIVKDDKRGVYLFKYTIKEEKEGRLSISTTINDESLNVSSEVIKMISITNYCVPWVERNVTITLEPKYGLPTTKVNADITIKILPEDEPTRWMYEYLAVAWLDPANRLIDSEWNYYNGEDILSSRWKEPVKIIRWSEEDIYTGNAKLLLEVPNVNYDKLTLLVCFVHPTPNGGFMDMVAAITTFHVTDKMVEEEEDEEESKTLPTQQDQQQQQQISRSGLNFGNICGSYVTDENFIRMRLEQSGSSVTADITVYLDPNDPHMPIDVAKFMYSYIMFRWYNLTNESFASEWTGRMQLITNWQELDSRVIGSTSYTTSIPSANSDDSLALIACFSHPWNNGYMDMNYVVKDITVISDQSQEQPSHPQQPNQPSEPTQPDQQQSESPRPKLIIPDFLCGSKDDPYHGYNDTFISLMIESIQDSKIDLTIKADYNKSGGTLPEPVFKWMYSYVILGWYDPLNNKFIEWYDPSTNEIIRTWQGYHPYAASPIISNWSNGIGSANVRIGIPSDTSDKLWLVACFAHPLPGGGFMDMNYTVVEVRLEHKYYKFSTIEELKSIIERELVINGLSHEKVKALLSGIGGIPEHGSIILQSKKGSLYLLALILPHDPPLEINDSISILVVYSSLDSTTTINSIKIYSISNTNEEVIGVLNPDQEPFIWLSQPIQVSKAGILSITADFIHNDGMHSTIVNNVSVRFSVVPESMIGVIGILVAGLISMMVYRRLSNN